MRNHLFYGSLVFAISSFVLMQFNSSYLMGVVFVASVGTSALLAYLKKDPKPVDESLKGEMEELKKRLSNLELRTGFLKPSDRMRV